MASLSSTATKVRKGILIAAIFVLVILAFDVVGKLFNSQYNPFIDQQSFYVDANASLGSIPAPVIPSKSINDDSTPTFSVEGAFASQPNTMLVYRLLQPRLTFDTVDSALATARALGFTASHTEEENETVMLWENASKTRSLRFVKLPQKWTMRTQYFFDSEALAPKQVNQDSEFYRTRASSLLSRLGFRDPSIARGVTVATLSKLGANGLFTKPVTPSGADYAVIDVYRELQASLTKAESQLTTQQRQVADKPQSTNGKVYKTDPRQGSFRAVVSDAFSQEAGKDVYAIDFTNFNYDPNYGIYNIVSPQEGWERVRQGEGSLTLIQLQADDYFAPSPQLTVTRFAANASMTELGYYEPDEWTGFIYPIYIFRGRVETADGKIGSFVFYVDALER